MPNENVRMFFQKMDDQGLKLTFNDVRLVPNHSAILPAETCVHSCFSKRIRLNIPIVSSPMDTVTDAPMAIAMAEAGGLGIIHGALAPAEQAKAVGRVKHRLHGKVFTPVPADANETVAELLEKREKKHWQFHTFPVLGADNVLLGVVTGNDFDCCMKTSQRVGEIMTPFDDLLTAGSMTAPEEALRLMTEHGKKTLPLIDDERRLAGFYVLSDLKRIFSHERTSHNLDPEGRLVVGAAIAVGDEVFERSDLLAAEGCDVFVIDTAHGDTSRMEALLRALKRRHPHIDVVAGNVSYASGAKRLADWGADGIRVGQGPGSICTTRIIAGVGTPQVSAVYECATAVENYGIPVCADGGISNSGDCVIAFAVGASSVMLGRLLAGADEAPGDVKIIDDKRVKTYRGMGSPSAMRDNASSRARYGQNNVRKSVAEGVEGYVPQAGPVRALLDQLTGGIRSGMGYHGAQSIPDIQERSTIFRFTPASLEESHPHHIQMHW